MTNVKHNSKYGKSKYKIGDIVNNKKILDIIPYHKDNNKQTFFKFKVECMKCHRIYFYNDTSALKGSNPDYCQQCKSNYILNGKTYYNYKSITEDFGVDATNVIHQYKLHNGDVSQVGKYHKSKYCLQSQCQHKIGDISKNRIIIGKEEHNPKNNTESKYIIKCLNCGKISKVSAKKFLTNDCKCISQHKAGNKIINRETPNKGRKYNLPKNISIIRNKYAVRVMASYNDIQITWKEYFYSIQECLDILPNLKKLALHYKKTGEYISYDKYLTLSKSDLDKIDK